MRLALKITFFYLPIYINKGAKMDNLFEENFPHMSPVWSRIFPIQAERAEGCYLYAVDGKKYLDFTCGIGVTNTGHCHPKVVEAIREQAGKFIHAQANIVVHKPMMQLIEELRTVVHPPAVNRISLSSRAASMGGPE
jgi:4-aminobutyrate aminotransferase-like enzyme